MKLHVRTENVIESSDWDALVIETYGRPYCFQQQDGCKERGRFRFTVPSAAYDYKNETIPEVVNHNEMGVSFAAWLARDPNKLLESKEDGADWHCAMWWERNFYPNMQMIANDLHSKGLLEAGTYTINIDW